MSRKLDEGTQVYWVCNLMVAESELLDIAAAEARFADLRTRFGMKVGLAHGRQDAALRDAALADFAAGRIQLLVATTVVEVGVDVRARASWWSSTPNVSDSHSSTSCAGASDAELRQAFACCCTRTA